MTPATNKTICIYDIEITSFSFIYGDYDINTNKYSTFVLSPYRDDKIVFKQYLYHLIESKSYQFGFNNLEYDYPMIHFILKLMDKKSWETISITELINKLNDKNRQLIPNEKEKKKNKFGKNYNSIWNPLIPQIDIFKIFHWDNASRKTSLKKAEINMRFNNVQDFDWNFVNTHYDESIEKQLIEYNKNDINATKELYYLSRGQLDKVTVNFPGMKALYSQDRLQFRIEIGKKYNKNMLNFSDVKIGEEINKITYLELSKRTWKEIKNKRTPREYISMKELIPDYIYSSFKDKELIELLEIMHNTIIDVNIPKFEYKFLYHGNIVKVALGGIHSDDRAKITMPDLIKYRFEEHDVSSMYPSAIITSKSYPLHLGPEWLKGYKYIRDTRVKLKPFSKTDKHTKMVVDTFKLALNGGGYGKTGDKHNYQYDPLVKYKTTIKCQLDILLYAQMLIQYIPDISMESWNTDGINFIYPKEYYEKVLEIKTQWEHIIEGQMEITPYRKIIRKDVNNYIALKENGKIKLKGIFELEKELHKDDSNHIVIMALVRYFIDNIPIETTIYNDTDIFNFLSTARVQNTIQGKWILYQIILKDKEKKKIKLQRINRYYISTDKRYSLIKELDGSKNKFSFIEKGYNPIVLNTIVDTNIKHYNIDYRYYIRKANEIKNQIENKQLKLF